MNCDTHQKPLVIDTPALLERLFAKAALSLTRDELREIHSAASDQAEKVARHASVIAHGIGRLVDADESVGAFRDRAGLCALLSQMAESYEQVAALLSVARSAGPNGTFGDRGGGGRH